MNCILVSQCGEHHVVRADGALTSQVGCVESSERTGWALFASPMACSEDSEAVAQNQWTVAVVDVIEGDQP